MKRDARTLKFQPDINGSIAKDHEVMYSELAPNKIMKITHQHIFITLTFAAALTACSKQNWYQGAQSAQTAHCMKEPLSEYEDCNQQSKESYEDYKDSRDKLDRKSESN